MRDTAKCFVMTPYLQLKHLAWALLTLSTLENLRKTNWLVVIWTYNCYWLVKCRAVCRDPACTAVLLNIKSWNMNAAPIPTPLTHFYNYCVKYKLFYIIIVSVARDEAFYCLLNKYSHIVTLAVFVVIVAGIWCWIPGLENFVVQQRMDNAIAFNYHLPCWETHFDILIAQCQQCND